MMLLGLSACALRAAIIGHEAFDYPSGTSAGQAGGTYWDWNNVVPTGHTGASATWDNIDGFVTAMVSNKTLVTTGTAAAKREFSADEMAGAFRGSGVIYFKVTMKRDANVQSSGLSSYDFGTERIFFGVPAALKDGQRKFAIQIIDGSPSDDDYSWTNIVAAADHDCTLVAKLDFNLDMLTLYVDPVLARPELANSLAQGITRPYTGGNWSTAVRLASSGAGTTTWDNLVVATTWEELALKSSLQAGLTAYWPFEDTLEDMADELPATANSVADNGTFMGPATDTGFAVGKFGRCYQSNGGSGYISVPFSADTTGVANGSSGFSVSAWFRADALDTSFQTLIAQGENTRWRVARYGTTANMSYAGGGLGVQDIQTTTSFAPPTGWVHLVAVTQTGVATRLYINGTLESANPSPPAISHDGLSNLFIGANPNATGREWNGAIDDVALWNRPLSADEIATLYAAGQSGQSLARLAANTLTVTTIADELHSPAGTQLSLREAIRDAARGDIIQFDSALSNKTITLGGTRLTIDKSLTLDADALYGVVYISGNNMSPVFEITAGNHLVALRSLAIIRGNAVSGLGGGIINHANLTANTCYLMDNAANNGAGLWNDGILTMTDVWLVRNQGQANGGGIYNQGALTVLRAQIGDNKTSASGYGGGIYNTGSLTLTRSTVSGNDAYSGGCLLYTSPSPRDGLLSRMPSSA